MASILITSCDSHKDIHVVLPSYSISNNSSTACVAGYKYGDKGTVPNLSEDKYYTTKDEVAYYINKFHKLPDNFVTKEEYQTNGSAYGSSTRIGGDYFSNKFGNNEYMISVAGSMTECDIASSAKNRGKERLVFSRDFRIFYTADHYESFQEYLGYKNWGPKFIKGQFRQICI